MILHFASLVRWEWFKTQRRLMPWILLAVLLFLTQATLWGTYFAYPPSTRDSSAFSYTVPVGSEGGGQSRFQHVELTCSDVLAGPFPEELPQEMRSATEDFTRSCERSLERDRGDRMDVLRRITLPGSLINGLNLTHGLGVLLFATMAASMVGSEFGWGTLRLVLARGTGRWQVLSSKLVLVALFSAAVLAIIAATTAVSSAIVGALVSEEPVPQAEWTEAATTLGRTAFSLLPYVVLAGLVTVVTSSSIAGITVVFGYFFSELLFVALLVNLFDCGQNVADYLLGRNITAWMMGNGRDEFSGLFFTSTPIGDFPGMLHAFLVLMTYMAVLGGLALWAFQRRDIGGATGG